MKCEVCLSLLEAYLDSELAEPETEQVRAHLITCVSCASERDGLAVEQEIYSRYDRALEIAPSMWGTIATRMAAESTMASAPLRPGLRAQIAGLLAARSLGWSFGLSFGGAVAMLLVAAVLGLAYLNRHQPVTKPSEIAKSSRAEQANPADVHRATNEPFTAAVKFAQKSDRAKSPVRSPAKSRRSSSATSGADGQSDVLFTDVAYSAAEEEETQRHIEQAQNLLRSVRNIEFDDDDTEIDVTYEKALSRQLLNENVVLRRDAEMSGKFPVKTLLSSLEPFLLDIANLPDKTSPDDLRVIKDRVEKTEIVAALHSY